VFPKNAEAAKEDRAWHRFPQSRAGKHTMKARIMRIVITLSSVAMIALAGGASLRGF
jgi:ABC-type Fe2+-enterobactin transport system substrate-binding protein